jgi:hypothetical protein
MSILNNAESVPDARVIAASAVAFFEANRHAEDISHETRCIALKLSHNIAIEMYREHE